MTIAGELADLMTQTVTIAPWAGTDANGQPQWGTAVAYRARVQQARRLVRGASGDQIVSTTQIILATAPAVSVKDKVTLPAGMSPASPPILAVHRSPDEAGVDVVSLFA